MRTMSIAVGILLFTAAVPALTMAHGTCAHEALHTYGGGVADSGGFAIYDLDGHEVISTPYGFGVSWIRDSETGDCDGDGVAFDFDGDLDMGGSTFAFGHGVWAEHCGYHVETAGSVTVDDFLWGYTVGFTLGSNDANGFLFDPETGENTCVTDGTISPGTDLEGDDCLSMPGVGTQTIVCPGGGDGLLWGFVHGIHLTVSPNGVGGANPGTLGRVTSP